jgi:RNA polymerase sigma-70 factor (ECF subfamily)
MPHEQLKQLFQLEFAKMVAVISNLFGLQHIELAEDIVSDTFLTAAEDWEKNGIPPNPTAWLYTVAKRKTIHQFRRQKIFDQKVVPFLSSEATNSLGHIDLDFSPKHIRDSQLQMLFAVCTPAIASEAQIGLALRILCGFGIDEIAEAFLSNKETINKRLFRAKEKLRTENIQLGLPPESEISARLDNVLHVIYLLFSEGYYSQTQNRILQKELCWEGMRLGVLLTEYELTNQPKTNALLALMCFHASRFNARQTSEAAVILYEEQDERLWDADLIRKGLQYLALSATGDQLSSYHLEARIASWHCIKEDTPGKWEEILQLYNQLLMVNYSPSVALNRTFALYKANGREQALIELEKLKLEGNYFYKVLRDFLRTLPQR